MKLVLHIGASGIGGLGQWLAGKRQLLSARGVHHPALFGAEDHYGLVKYALLRSQVAEAAPGSGPFASLDDQKKYRDRMRAALEREVARTEKAKAKSWLLSDENLYHLLASHGMVKVVREFLGQYFEQMLVVIHLRPQIDLLPQEVVRRAKAGFVVSETSLFGPDFGPAVKHLNYDILVGRWERMFGAENVRLVPFRRKPDIIGEICNEAGIDAGVLGSDRPGEGMPVAWRPLALANAVNQGGTGIPRLAGLLDSVTGSEPLTVPQTVARSLQGRFSQNNGKLVDRRRDVTLDDLTPDFSTFPREGTLSLIEANCPFAEQLSELVDRMNSRLAVERYCRLLAELRQAVAERRRDGLAELQAEINRLAPVLSGRGGHIPYDGPPPILAAAAEQE